MQQPEQTCLQVVASLSQRILSSHRTSRLFIPPKKLIGRGIQTDPDFRVKIRAIELVLFLFYFVWFVFFPLPLLVDAASPDCLLMLLSLPVALRVSELRPRSDLLTATSTSLCTNPCQGGLSSRPQHPAQRTSLNSTAQAANHMKEAVR